MSGIDPGRLDKRVTFEADGEAPNGQGGYTAGWAAIATLPTVWAEIVGLSGDEALKAGAERNVQLWRVTIRRREDLTTKLRMTRGGKAYDIKSIMPDPKSDDATLLICETGSSTTGA